MSGRKSSLEEIRTRFDHQVERYSNLETGQPTAIDAAYALDLIAALAKARHPQGGRLLDLGCGAGNFSLKLCGAVTWTSLTLVDLSAPMLARAQERLRAATNAPVTAIQTDLMSFAPAPGSFDVVVAAAVLHHLREPEQWEHVFRKIHDSLAPGGSFWIYDFVTHEDPAVASLLWRRYGEFLEKLGGAAFRDSVLEYVRQEDSPRSVAFQLELLRHAGFAHVDVLHQNGVFAAIGATKS